MKKLKLLQAKSYKLKAARRGQALRLRSGQAMLLTVILLSTAMIGATSLAALLMVYEIRYSGDVVSSAQALFAADAGIECASYNHYKQPVVPVNCGTKDSPVDDLSNGATFYVEVYEPPSGLITLVDSFGRSNQTARAFRLVF